MRFASACHQPSVVRTEKMFEDISKGNNAHLQGQDRTAELAGSSQRSHGCVRLSVKNAATLWGLVKHEKMANTKVVLSGAIPDAGPPTVARSRPMPLTPDEPLYRAPPPQDQRRYDARLPLPPPFFIFGR